MWLFLPDAFVSIVVARHLDRPGRPVDPERLCVRARRREHLDVLVGRHPDLLGACSITGSSTTDYAWRLICPKAAFAEVVRREVLAISWPNFKDEATRRATSSMGSRTTPAWLSLLHTIWRAALILQRPERDPESKRAWWESPSADQGDLDEL